MRDQNFLGFTKTRAESGEVIFLPAVALKAAEQPKDQNLAVRQSEVNKEMTEEEKEKMIQDGIEINKRSILIN